MAHHRNLPTQRLHKQQWTKQLAKPKKQSLLRWPNSTPRPHHLNQKHPHHPQPSTPSLRKSPKCPHQQARTAHHEEIEAATAATVAVATLVAVLNERWRSPNPISISSPPTPNSTRKTLSKKPSRQAHHSTRTPHLPPKNAILTYRHQCERIVSHKPASQRTTNPAHSSTIFPRKRRIERRRMTRGSMVGN
jgi:hypothetical protein